jgi:Domain of unknown function (DUF4357)
VNLDNGQEPSADKRRLPEADQANMEAFLANLKTILPVVGLDLLKPRPKAAIATGTPVATQIANETKFMINHKSGVKAVAVEEDGEFIVLEGSQALRDTDYARNSYAKLKQDLIGKGVLKITSDPTRYEFSVSYAFSSPSAAGSVILDRNTNGRTRWFVQGTRQTYHDWQESNVS